MYQPKFTITNKILKNIGVIEAAREVIDNAPILPYYEKEFRKDALVRSVHFGTHIEGNELDLKQTEKVIMGQNVVARERDIQEVINYRKVIEFIGELGTSENTKLTEEVVKKIHILTVKKILPDEKCGVFRTTQVVVKNNQTGEVSFRPPLAVAVPFEIKDLLEFVNKTGTEEVHPIIKSGVFHYEFVKIHPFLDGNGRVARAIATLILFFEGYDIRRFFSLEEYFDNNAGEYYEALQSVMKMSGDLTHWLEYFTEGLSIELSKIKNRVERVSVDAKLKEKLGGKPIMLSDRQLKLIEYVQKMGFVQNKTFKELFPMVSEDTILNELKALIEAGIIRKQGSTKSARYIMT